MHRLHTKGAGEQHQQQRESYHYHLLKFCEHSASPREDRILPTHIKILSFVCLDKFIGGIIVACNQKARPAWSHFSYNKSPSHKRRTLVILTATYYCAMAM